MFLDGCLVGFVLFFTFRESQRDMTSHFFILGPSSDYLLILVPFKDGSFFCDFHPILFGWISIPLSSLHFNVCLLFVSCSWPVLSFCSRFLATFFKHKPSSVFGFMLSFPESWKSFSWSSIWHLGALYFKFKVKPNFSFYYFHFKISQTTS